MYVSSKSTLNTVTTMMNKTQNKKDNTQKYNDALNLVNKPFETLDLGAPDQLNEVLRLLKRVYELNKKANDTKVPSQGSFYDPEVEEFKKYINNRFLKNINLLQKASNHNRPYV